MKWLIAFVVLLILGGGILAAYASTLPVYTDEEAPGRLALKLADLPREKRSSAWYAQLRAFETPHNSLSDLGRGLIAAGVGLGFATAFISFYNRHGRMRSAWCVFSFWLILWAVRVPLSLWYYGLRAKRFEYPTWGDSIAIPVVSETVTWAIGAIVSGILLALLLIRHPLPEGFELRRPTTVWGWIRTAILGLWLAVNAVCAYEGVVDGNEGMTMTSIASGGILLLFLAAKEIEPDAEPNGGPATRTGAVIFEEPPSGN